MTKPPIKIAVLLVLAVQSTPADAQTLTTLYSFKGGADGQQPQAGLLLQRGMLYGTTSAGGTSDLGTVFRVNPATGAETVLYDFAGGTDGEYPLAGLINHGGALYGVTSGGGASNAGTVFRITLATGGETVLYSFAGDADGSSPYGGLIYQGDDLYGTTAAGGGTDCGGSGCGTVFKVNPKTGVEAVIYRFDGITGNNPYGGLVYTGATLFGTTFNGGSSGNGTIFKLDPKTGTEAVLYSFKGNNAHPGYPDAALVSCLANRFI
jgi:uncharacterized repeat protein (TIGR03803 family)